MTEVSDKIYTEENPLYHYNGPKFTVGIKVVLTFSICYGYAVLLRGKDSIFSLLQNFAIRRNKKRAWALAYTP